MSILNPIWPELLGRRDKAKVIDADHDCKVKSDGPLYGMGQALAHIMF